MKATEASGALADATLVPAADNALWMNAGIRFGSRTEHLKPGKSNRFQLDSGKSRPR
jgi:hypothetical protein